MRSILRVAAVATLAAGIIAGCGGEPAPAAPPATRPVKTFVVAGGEGSAVRKFPGRIEASQRAVLAFRVSGTVQEIAVKEGELVTEGQVLARLDPTDFAIVLNDREAGFDNAQRNFSRARELVEKGAISRLDYDRMEAQYKSSEAALAAARQDLAYTELKAPFSGRVASRAIDNFEEVQAKQEILQLQNTDQLDVIIGLPENLVRELRREAAPDSGSAIEIPMYAQFEGHAALRFPLQTRELATKAAADTQTFQVRLTMPSPREIVVLPGMTANVTVDFSAVTNSRVVYRVPATALVADAKLGAQVWIVDPHSMTVSPRSVAAGRLTDDQVEITEGLYGGEEIVSVGAAYLAEGMKVTRMPVSEQAVPRSDDPS